MTEPKFFLEGTWKGKGKVVDTLDFEEELEFSKVKPGVFFYQQRTKGANGEPIHFEAGYVRIFREHNAAEGKIELAVSHPFGVCEISEGSITDTEAKLKATAVTKTSSAIEPYVTKLARSFVLKDSETLQYNADMGSSNPGEECPHVVGELKKVK